VYLKTFICRRQSGDPKRINMKSIVHTAQASLASTLNRALSQLSSLPFLECRAGD
jgi:hypothetical protein